MIDEKLIAIAVCCREWPVLRMVRIGPCGLCGEKPVIKE